MQLPTTPFAEIFLVEDMSGLLELLDGLGISVIPVCFTKDRNNKDCSITNN